MGRRTLAAAAAVLGTVLVLGACTDGEAPGPSGTTDATSSPGGGPTATPTSDAEGDVRDRLVQALQDDTTGLGDLVSQADTSLTVLETPWLQGWQVVDVLSRAGSHGTRAYVGLSQDGTAVLLSGAPDAFVEILGSGAASVPDEDTAVQVVDTYLDATRSFRGWSERIASFDDVRLRPDLDAEAQASVDAARATLADQVAPTAAVSRGDGFDVVAWVQDGAAVVRHEVHVGRDGSLSDRPATLVSDLPAPISR